LLLFFWFQLRLMYFNHLAQLRPIQAGSHLRIIFIFLVEFLFSLNYLSIFICSYSCLFKVFIFNFPLSVFFLLLLDIVFWNQKIVASLLEQIACYDLLIEVRFLINRFHLSNQRLYFYMHLYEELQAFCLLLLSF